MYPLNEERFRKSYNDVVAWNLISRNGEHKFTTEEILNQAKYVKSEIMETFDGLMADDVKEILDGVADVFVTFVYQHYLCSAGFTDFNINILNQFVFQNGVESRDDSEEIKEDFKDLLRWIYDSADYQTMMETDLCNLMRLMIMTEHYYKVSIFDVIDSVMKSNFTKFPLVDEVDHQFECDRLNQKHPEHAPVVPVVNLEHGRVVFRGGNGAGKILKPTTFKEPQLAGFLYT